MRKVFASLAIVLVIALAFSANTVLAKKGPQAKPVNYQGTLTAVSIVSGSGTVTLTLRDASSVTVAVNTDSRINIPKKNVVRTLTTGMRVNVRAISNGSGGWIANNIQMIPGQPLSGTFNGTLVSYTAYVAPDQDGSLVISAGSPPTTFKVDEDTQIVGDAALLAVPGSLVSVQAETIAAQTAWLAKVITVTAAPTP